MVKYLLEKPKFEYPKIELLTLSPYDEYKHSIKKDPYSKGSHKSKEHTKSRPYENPRRATGSPSQRGSSHYGEESVPQTPRKVMFNIPPGKPNPSCSQS